VLAALPYPAPSPAGTAGHVGWLAGSRARTPRVGTREERRERRTSAPGPPLLAPSARQWAGALLACCAILVAVLGVVFAHQARADWLDHAVDSPIITWLGGHPRLMLWLAAPGSLIPTGLLSAVIAVACLLTGRLGGAVLAAVAVPAAVGLVEGLLKPLVGRTYLGVLAYPSGHTTAMFALAATVTVLLLVPPQPAEAGALRVLIPAVTCVLGGVVALALIDLCDGTTSPTPWPAPPSVSERSAGSR
jgi:hypothetical protein